MFAMQEAADEISGNMKTHLEATRAQSGGICTPNGMRVTRCGQILDERFVFYKSWKRYGPDLTCKHCRKSIRWS